MPAAALLLAALLGVLVGSVPFAYLLVRWRTGADVSAEGSRNVGALNALRVSRSRGTGLLVLVLDGAKGLAAALLARALVPAPGADLAAVVGAVAGHDYNPWLSLRAGRPVGGKGFATAGGGFLATAPALVLAWIGVVAATWSALRVARSVRDEAPATAAATLLLPLAGALLGGPPEAAAACGIAALVLPRLLPESVAVLRASGRS